MKKKILFVNDEMTLGGVSRILNNLLNQLDKNKYEIDLLVLHPHGELMNEIPEWINIIPSCKFFESVDMEISTLIHEQDILGIFRKIFFVLAMKSGLMKNIIKSKRKKLINKKYDVEFSSKEGFCTIFIAYGNTPYKLNWIQTDYKENNYAHRHMKLLKQALAHIDTNIACSKQVSDSFKEVFKTNNIVVVRNLINDDKIRTLANETIHFDFFTNKTINLIAVARFHPQKGINRLIQAVKYVKEFDINVRLVLIGDGPLMNDLKEQVNNANLSDEIIFLGYQLNPYPYIKLADLFVLSSHYEGYPTIVIESLICTTPVLAMKVAGITDQITEDCHGWIINNKQNDLNIKLLEIVKNKSGLIKKKQNLNSFHYDNEKILNEICYYIDNLDESIKI